MNKMIIKRIKLYGIYVLAGIVSAAVACFADLDDFQTGLFSGFATALIILGTIRIIQLYRLSKDTDRAEEWIAKQKEERTVFIANKAKSWTFYIFIFVELIGGLGCIFIMDNKLLGEALNYLCAAQCICYVIVYRILDKKY